MKQYKVKDLQFEYSWNPMKADDNKWIADFPDNRLLDRYEGFEVLPFLNRYMKNRNYLLPDAFVKLETALRQSMPKEIRSHRMIKKWLDDNCCF